MSMYLTGSPFSKSVPIARATSSPFHASVTFFKRGSSAIASSASRPMKSWSNFTNGQ
jgi:hypothetical protein